MKDINPYLSRKIKLISFILTIFVVYLHSYNLPKDITISYDYSTLEFFNVFLQRYISHGITRIAVPIFFAISAYLFFLDFTPSIRNYYIKVKKKFYTLAIPYLAWNICGIGLYYIIQIMPFARTFISSKLIKDYSILDYFYKMLISPIPYQMWYIRDLIIFIIISPLIYLLLNTLKSYYIIFLLSVWLLGFSAIGIEGLLFFSIGAYIAMYNISFDVTKTKLKIALIVAWLILLVFTSLLFINNQMEEYLFYIRISILLGVFSVWTGYDLIGNFIQNIKYIQFFSSFSFFIFAAHEPILTVIKKVLIKLDLNYLIVYLLAPVMTIAIAIGIAYIIKGDARRLYFILTGNR